MPLSISLANWRNGYFSGIPRTSCGKNDGKAENDDVFPRAQGRLYQSDDDKHIATPRFSMVPPQSSRIPRFSSGLQGIVAYMSVKDDLSPEQLDKLRSRFRMAGAYQEAAVVGLARAVIIAFDTRTRKKREEIIRSAISEALRERPGVYFDHASRDNEWAEDGTVGQRNKSYKSDDFIGAFGLRRVTQEPNETVGVTVSHAPLYDQRGSYKSFSWIYNPRGRRKSGLDPDVLEKYYKSGKEERARIAQSTVRSYGCSIHQSIRAVEQLLPYLVLAETLEHPRIKVAEWFSRRPELEYRVHDELVEGTFGAQDFLENKLLPWTGLQDAEGMTKSHSLEELIEDLSSTGDGWMYELSTNGYIFQDLSIPHSWSHGHVDNVRMTISEILPRNLRRLFQNLFRVPETLNVESVKGKKIATKEIVPGGIRPSQTQSYSSESTEDLQKALDRIKEALERRREASE